MSNIDETFAAKDKKTSPWKISCLIVFINLFVIPFFLWGIDEAYAAWQLQTNGIITQGTVVRLEEEYSEGECCVYRPVIEFEVNNQVYTFPPPVEREDHQPGQRRHQDLLPGHDGRRHGPGGLRCDLHARSGRQVLVSGDQP